MRDHLRYHSRMTVRTRFPARGRVAGAPTPPGTATDPSARVPTNLSLPRDLVAQVDALAGPRGRSAFVEEALRKAVRRERLRVAWAQVAGALSAEEYPYWRTSEDVVSWVRGSRAEETDAGTRR